MANATNPPNTTAYRNDISHVTGSFAAALSLGSTGSVFAVKPGALRITTMHSTAVRASATATMTWVAKKPNHRTNRGVKKAESAVPTMPIPKTPVAKPRRAGSYQLFANGIPTAKIVPATPRKNPNTSSSG